DTDRDHLRLRAGKAHSGEEHVHPEGPVRQLAEPSDLLPQDGRRIAAEGHDPETAGIAHRRRQLGTRHGCAHGRDDDGDVDAGQVAEPRPEHVAGYHAPDDAATACPPRLSRNRTRRRRDAAPSVRRQSMVGYAERAATYFSVVRWRLSLRMRVRFRNTFEA